MGCPKTPEAEGVWGMKVSDYTVLSSACELRRIGALRRWERRLQKSDSVFARLVFVSQLRDSSGRYVDSFLMREFPARTCHGIVAEAHRQVFREWLALSTRTRLRDFRTYCYSICCKTEIAEAAWASLCRELVPSGISIDELSLFCETAKHLGQLICPHERRFD